MSGCDGRTDAAIVAVAQGCPNLTHLDVRYCKQLTDKAIVAVAQHCPNLTHIYVSALFAFGCKQLTDAAITDFRARRPNVDLHTPPHRSNWGNKLSKSAYSIVLVSLNSYSAATHVQTKHSVATTHVTTTQRW